MAARTVRVLCIGWKSLWKYGNFSYWRKFVKLLIWIKDTLNLTFGTKINLNTNCFMKNFESYTVPRVILTWQRQRLGCRTVAGNLIGCNGYNQKAVKMHKFLPLAWIGHFTLLKNWFSGPDHRVKERNSVSSFSMACIMISDTIKRYNRLACIQARLIKGERKTLKQTSYLMYVLVHTWKMAISTNLSNSKINHGHQFCRISTAWILARKQIWWKFMLTQSFSSASK